MDTKRLARLRTLSLVQRWAVIPTIQRQNVAEHSFHVLCVGMYYSQYLKAPISVDTMARMAMEHDEPESITGDITANFKPKIREVLTEYEKSKGFDMADSYSECELIVLKLADLTEALLFCNEELMLGNRRIRPVWDEIWDRACAVQDGMTKMWDWPKLNRELGGKLPLDYLIHNPDLISVVGLAQV